jgi:hypothetical protein
MRSQEKLSDAGHEPLFFGCCRSFDCMTWAAMVCMTWAAMVNTSVTPHQIVNVPVQCTS